MSTNTPFGFAEAPLRTAELCHEPTEIKEAVKKLSEGRLGLLIYRGQAYWVVFRRVQEEKKTYEFVYLKEKSGGKNLVCPIMLIPPKKPSYLVILMQMLDEKKGPPKIAIHSENKDDPCGACKSELQKPAPCDKWLFPAKEVELQAVEKSYKLRMHKGAHLCPFWFYRTKKDFDTNDVHDEAKKHQRWRFGVGPAGSEERFQIPVGNGKLIDPEMVVRKSVGNGPHRDEKIR